MGWAWFVRNTQILRLLKRRRSAPVFVVGMLLAVTIWSYATRLSYVHSKHTTTKIVIFTYMRSGSTMTGSLFDSSPDIFYSYEPLMPLYSSTNNEMDFLQKPPRSKSNYTDEATAIIRATLDCRFDSMDLESLSNHHARLSLDTEPYFKCFTATYPTLSRTALAECLPLLTDACLSKSVRVVKEIRLPMESIDEIMNSDHSVKMIHLFRDPRATIRSQMMYGNSPSTSVYPYAKKTCTEFLRDIHIRQALEMKYPGRFYVLFYEDLARAPQRVTKNIFKFANIQYTSAIEAHVDSITSAKFTDNCLLCVHKSNSTYASQKWRETIGYDVVLDIDDACADVYKVLRYISVETERQLRTLDEPLRTS